MDYSFSRGLRIISCIALFFFLWTFELSGIAFAIKNNQQPSAKQTSKTSPEKKIGKDIEDIDNILKDTTTDTDMKKNKLKAKRSEIEADASEIRKTFAENEKTLQEKGLPQEILERHRSFVKKYDDNYKELQSNLDAIDKAKTTAEADTAIAKTKAFIKKTKAPTKRKPIDPTKLPHRSPEEKQVILEEWKAPEKPAYLQKNADIQAQKPIVIAANGSLKGLLNSNPQLLAENNIQLALVTPVKRAPVTEADLAETPEILFTPAIKAKAAELGNKPVKIYNWVRNNIEYVPTFGSMQGAEMCLQTKQCNDTDTASLLIALLRVSNIPARYAYGTIERPIEKIMNWTGGFTDSMEALRLLASAGIPVKGMTIGGQIKYAQLEHVWVEARVLYGPFRGAGGVDNIPTWIPLDASYKQYKYTPGIDIKTGVPFDAQPLIDQIKATATINEAQGYVTNVSSPLVQQSMQDYQAKVQNYISQNKPNATVGDVLGRKEIIKEEFPYLLGTLHKRVIAKMWEQPTLADNLKHTITFNVIKDIYDNDIGTPINTTKKLAELAGKKITLSYSPATSQDESVINSFLPKPHPDGSPIQPGELPSSLPAYLINLKPELRIDGVVVATGTAVGMGNKETFTLTFAGPGPNGNDIITNDITAGQYLGLGLDLGRISQEQITAIKTKLQATKAKVDAQDFSSLSRDDVMGDILYNTALVYYAELDVMDYFASKAVGLVAIRLPSESIFSVELSVKSFFGVPYSIGPGGFAIDVDRAITLVKSLDGNKDNPKQFMLASGMNSSALEHIVPEQFFSTPENPAYGISAVRAIKVANDQGIPIFTVTQSNINTVLPQLQLDSETIADIQNAVNAGKEVTVSKTDITYNGWTGCGYIMIDPATGAGAYMIGGGLSGGWLILFWVSLALLSFLLTIVFPGFGALILISVFTSLAQLFGSSFIKYNLGWDDYQITSQQGLTAFLDIIVQITLGALTYNMLPPGIASNIIYIFKTIAAYAADWVIFFFTRNDILINYFIVFDPKRRGAANV